MEERAQPLLALVVALARDPLLRGTQEFILGQAKGVTVPREVVEDHISSTNPDRFSPALVSVVEKVVA